MKIFCGIQFDYGQKRLSTANVAFKAVAAIVTDSLFACTARTADQLLSKYVPVWAYEFKDTNAPELFNLPTVFPYGAAHASQLQFLFNPNAFFPNLYNQVSTDPFPRARPNSAFRRKWSSIGPISSRRSTPTSRGRDGSRFWRDGPDMATAIGGVMTALPMTSRRS